MSHFKRTAALRIPELNKAFKEAPTRENRAELVMAEQIKICEAPRPQTFIQQLDAKLV